MNSITEKKCSGCKTFKPINEFAKSSRSKTGYGYYCFNCRKEQRLKTGTRDYIRFRLWVQLNKEKIAKYKNDWDKKNVERARERKRTWWRKNSEKANSSRRDVYQEKNEILREKRRNWLAKTGKTREYNHARRARKIAAGGVVTSQEWLALCEKYNNKCLCCGRDDVKLTLDHVMPLVLGGSNTIDNIQPLCQSCNSRKQKKYIDYRVG